MAGQAAHVPEPDAPVASEDRSDEDAVESLRKEIERLRARLEEERKKLNDVTCETSADLSCLRPHFDSLFCQRVLSCSTRVLSCSASVLCCSRPAFSRLPPVLTSTDSIPPVSTAATRLDHLGNLNIKQRRLLKGHQGKVLCLDWSSADKRHVVSSSQDGKMIIWDAFTTNKVPTTTLASQTVTFKRSLLTGTRHQHAYHLGHGVRVCSIWKPSRLRVTSPFLFSFLL